MSVADQPAEGFDALYGVVLSDVEPEQVLAELSVREDLRDRSGGVHGGVLAALAESAACAGTRLGVEGAGYGATGLSNFTTRLAPIAGATLRARATRRHAGRTTWVWEVEIVDDSERICSFSRVTVAIRET
jgi:uncharacterized protein (TIGR00369 family)